MDTIIFGNGNLGRAIAAALIGRGEEPPRLVGRPAERHRVADLAGATLVFEVSRADAVVPNLTAALAAGCRRFVIATTGWDDARAAVAEMLAAHSAAAVAAPNFSLGVAFYLRLVELAAKIAAQIAPASPFDPYVLEWHRRGKLDRPSGTAREIVRRMGAGAPASITADRAASQNRAALEVVSVRAGASPGMHLVTFDAPGETIELRHTARDRSAFATGAIAAADWLSATARAPGLHGFDEVIDELLAIDDKPEAVIAS